LQTNAQSSIQSGIASDDLLLAESSALQPFVCQFFITAIDGDYGHGDETLGYGEWSGRHFIG
jgi:hypothetical protein